MKIRFPIILLLLFFLLVISAVILAQSYGVLVGLRQDEILSQPLPYDETADASHRASYRTLWIFGNEKDSASIMEINKLIVPRNNGFWSIEVIRQKQGGWVEDCLICAPIDQKPTTPLLDSITVAECEGNKRLSIIFVGKDHISYEGGSDGYCQGAAHPWHVHYLKTASIDYSSGEGLPISAVLGSGANLALQTGAKRYFSRNPDDRLNPEPDATN